MRSLLAFLLAAGIVVGPGTYGPGDGGSVLSATTCATYDPPGLVRAFPGAQGHGAQSVGGRGGTVLRVTNLNDTGAGSLRAAVEVAGARTIVFDIGGTLTVDSRLEITDPFITIAGQTAPGDGFQIKASGDFPLFYVRNGGADVIMRYLTLRNGDPTDPGPDNISVYEGTDLIFDHISMYWAADESFQLWHFTGDDPIANVTVQRSIIAETFKKHSTGMILGGQYTTDEVPPTGGWNGTSEVSIHKNLFAHNSHRNPRAAGLNTEHINNVVYNWQYRIGASILGVTFDYVNNYAKVGPQGVDLSRLMQHEDNDNDASVWPDPSIYSSGTIVEPNHHVEADWATEATTSSTLWSNRYSTPADDPLPAGYYRATRQADAPIPVCVMTAREAFIDVQADVGNNKRLNCDGTWTTRPDSVDTRVLGEVSAGTGWAVYPDTVAEAGGYPTYSDGSSCTDTDGDGIPDAFENLHASLDVGVADGTTVLSSGRTNLEWYLNGAP